MNLIKKFDRQALLAEVKQKTYKSIVVPNGWAQLMESLSIRGLIEEDFIPSYTEGNMRVWADNILHHGIRLETTTCHPTLGSPIDMVATGSKEALELFDAALQLHAVVYEGSQTATPKITHEYHDELNPALWDEENGTFSLKDDVREQLMDIAAEFVLFQKMNDLEIQDIVITGSCANFNWTSLSDMDLHLMVNMKKTIKQYGPLVPEYFEAKRKVWSDLHSISIYGIPVEPYMQDVDEKHHSTAIYSIANNEWNVEPTHQPPTIDDVEIKSKLKQFMSDIDDAVSGNRSRPVEDLMDKIKALRKQGLEESGEFSSGNLIFKELRRNGYFEKLAECKTKLYDTELSIEDEEWDSLTY